VQWIDRSVRTEDDPGARAGIIHEAAVLASRTAPRLSDKDTVIPLPPTAEELLPYARQALAALEREWSARREAAIRSEVLHGSLANFREMTDKLACLGSADTERRESLAQAVAEQMVNDRHR
jgi:hypothetical protein